MKQTSLLYEGKAKKVYATDVMDQVIVDYKDDATANNGLKRGHIANKGIINNKMSNILFKELMRNGIETHLIEELSERKSLVKRVDIIPIEVIIRNKIAGSFALRMKMEEGSELHSPIIEYSYKDDALGDPMINESIALALRIVAQQDIDTINHLAYSINTILQSIFQEIHIELIDFKLEFGRYHDKIILADEISPDTCRLWDMSTHAHLDKDRFRRDLGNIEDAYQEVFKRLDHKFNKGE